MNTLRVAWNVPTIAANQRPLVFVAVEVRSDPSFPFAEVARAGAVASPGHTDLTLDDGTYEVRVRANDGTDFGPYSDVGSIALAAIPPAIAPPSKLEGLTLSQIG